ncbi:hypothetical protein Tco_1268364 [Tanacetum coccineum]
MAKIQEVIPAANEATGPVFDKEPLEHVHNDDEYNVFAIEKEHPEQPGSINDTYVVEQEHALLASLIDNMKLEIDENKKMNKNLKASNTSLITELESFGDYPVKEVFPKAAFQKQPTKLEKRLYETLENNKVSKSMQAFSFLPQNVFQLSNIVLHCLKLIRDDSWIVQSSPDIKRVLELQLQPTLMYMSKNLEKFKQALKEEMVEDLRYFNSLEKEVESLRFNENFKKLNQFVDIVCELGDKTDHYKHLETELSKKSSQISENDFAKLEKHFINLELALKNEKEKNVCENS